ncbi:Sulphatase-modifying factor protein [Haliscomenobacter hydrossis DSM 1100]|uniref:Sulphatase-modifying factor protein n=2 Tax=Haliscomenobacter TaxID=2349 RepID=F4KU23_HALH1|nr:Sulphatase-modifying factor protein [Haliscomenobacter hydrossis DSM 1100]
MTKLGAQHLIAKGKLPEAIEATLTLLNDYLSKHADDAFTLDLRNALISNAGKLAELSQNKIKGIVHRDDESLIFSRVNAAVLDIIEQLPASVWAGSTASKTITEQLKTSKLLQDFVQKYGDDHPTNAFVELHETVVQTFGAYDDWSLLRVLEEMVEENKVRQEAISVHIPKATKAFVANHQGEWKPAQWLKFKDEIFAEHGQAMSVRELADYLEETKSRFKEMLKDFVLIKGGEFMMGASDDDPDASTWEKPQHQVRVSDFYMCKYVVTLAQFEEFIYGSGYRTDADKHGGSNVSHKNNVANIKTGVNWSCNEKGELQNDKKCPVIHVSWNDAIAFCNYWNVTYGFPCTYSSKGELLDFNGKVTTELSQVHGFRLPSEAEWEYACRAGTTSCFYTGNTLTQSQSNFNNHLGRTKPTGSFPPNSWGVFDMHGNVWEWCHDYFGAKFYHECRTHGIRMNPWKSEQTAQGIVRGGSWFSDLKNCRSSNRLAISPSISENDVGFRVVLFLPPDSWPVPSK